jgi:hypothetical protein
LYPRQTDEGHGTRDQPEEGGDQDPDRHDLRCEDRADCAKPLLEPLELELAAGGERDQGDRQCVEQTELFDHVVIQNALVKRRRKTEAGQRFGQRWAEHEACDQVARDVGEADLTDQPADRVARQNDEAERKHPARVERVLAKLLELIERNHAEQEQHDHGDLPTRVGFFPGRGHAV